MRAVPRPPRLAGDKKPRTANTKVMKSMTRSCEGGVMGRDKKSEKIENSRFCWKEDGKFKVEKVKKKKKRSENYRQVNNPISTVISSALPPPPLFFLWQNQNYSDFVFCALSNKPTYLDSSTVEHRENKGHCGGTEHVTMHELPPSLFLDLMLWLFVLCLYHNNTITHA